MFVPRPSSFDSHRRVWYSIVITIICQQETVTVIQSRCLKYGKNVKIVDHDDLASPPAAEIALCTCSLYAYVSTLLRVAITYLGSSPSDVVVEL